MEDMLTANCDVNELSKVSGIYYIINLITKKKYIGSSTNLYRRWRDHSINSSNFELKKDINLHGIENFIFKVIDIYDNILLADLLKVEQEHLNIYYAQEYKNSNYIDKRFRELLYNYIPESGNYSAFKKWKENSKEKIKLNRKGNKNSNYGNRLDNIQKQRIKDGIKRAYENGHINPNQGKKTSEQKKRNIIEGQKRAGKIKEVYSLNLKTREILSHESMKAASIVTKIDAADIRRVCLEQQRYSKEYYFSYEKIDNVDIIINNIKQFLSSKKENAKKKYYVLNTFDNTITNISSLRDVAFFCRCSVSSVIKCRKNKNLLKDKYKIMDYDNQSL